MIISQIQIDAIGYAAATMTTFSFVPQLLRVIRLRSARDISLGMFLIFSVVRSLGGLMAYSCTQRRCGSQMR